MKDWTKARAPAISLVLHIGAFVLLTEAPPLDLTIPPPSPSEYQQAFAGKEDKIVWYKFRDLPNVQPKAAPKTNRPLRVEAKAKQAMISSPKNAPRREQAVLTPAPAIDLPPPDLPNMVAVKLPPKQFTTPPDLVQPEAARLTVPDAPDVSAPSPLPEAKLPALRLPPKALSAPPAVPARQPVAKVEAPSEAPPLEARAATPAKLPDARLPGRPFIPPNPTAAPPPRKIVAASDAPSPIAVAVSAPAIPAARLPARAYVPPASAPASPHRAVESPTEAAAFSPNQPAAAAMPQAKLPSRAFAPPASTVSGPKATLSTPAPFEGPPGDMTIAIAGINPGTAKLDLPPAASPARFAAGEKIQPRGEDADGSFKGLTVPDLFARSSEPHPDQKPDLVAFSYSPSIARPGRSTDPSRPTDSATPHALSTRVSSAPDPRLNGRDIYMMAIQMPNLTSYSGSWLMWYAARTAREADQQPIAAPVAHRKVDPKYTPAAIDEHIEGKVLLYCVIGKDGLVGSVQLVRGADERLNRSAEEALAKWEFYPATRNGQPVDVDVVVEIPFLLAPRTASK